MAIRGMLAFDENGNLISIDPNATDPLNPSQDEIIPIEVRELIADEILTEDVDVSNVTKGSTTTYLTGAEQTTNGGVQNATQPTDDVSTSATTIFDLGDASTPQGGIAIVYGQEQGSANEFIDVLTIWRLGGSPTTQHSETINTPAGRTYSTDANNLQLAMASGTYDVVLSAVLSRRDRNATS